MTMNGLNAVHSIAEKMRFSESCRR